MELGRWFKKWVEQNSEGWDFNDGPDVEGWLSVSRSVDTLTVTHETEHGPVTTEYYRVTRIAEPPTGIAVT